MTILSMIVCVIFCKSLCKCSVLNSFDISSTFAIVLSDFLLLLKPVVILVFIVCKAVMVENIVLNPCWCVWLCKFLVM